MINKSIRSTGRTALTAAVALVLSVSSIGAFAQPRPDIVQNQRHDNRNDHRNDHRNDRRDDHRNDRRDDHRSDRRDDRRYDGRPGYRPAPPPVTYSRGAGPDYRWHRGDRLPPSYRSRTYVVDNWGSHRLSAPPRGYQWVQYGGDYLLVAIATGVIASMILNSN